MRSSAQRTHLLVKDFNQLLTCKLCNGYMIEPMTVDTCLHSYCRSCIGKHLLNEEYCPQCKQLNTGKHISHTNVKLDEALRAIIYKLVPGLYHKEQERKLHYLTKKQIKQDAKSDYKELVEAIEQEEREQDVIFFAPAEPISLSLEYHAGMLGNCAERDIPAVRYLQCPAGVKIQHLKRFLCSKYDIDPDNKLVQIEVMYEDEILPNDLTLMDVGYCYNWRRQAPMQFQYRILIYDEPPSEVRPLQDINAKRLQKKRQSSQSKTVTFADEQIQQEMPTNETSILQTILKLKPSKETYYQKYAHVEHTKEKHKKKAHKMSATAELQPPAPMKVIIARKPADPKKHSSKRSHADAQTFTVTSDFKSLRSNDIRYSNDYSVTSTTAAATTTTKTVHTSNAKQPKQNEKKAMPTTGTTPPATPKCDIVVSIPQYQLPKSPFADGDEPVALPQLKTASKKANTYAIVNSSSNNNNNSSTTNNINNNNTTSKNNNNNNNNINNNNNNMNQHNNNNNSTADGKKCKNVPKLKIELNSLKTKITIPKPKSADVRQNLEHPASKAFKQRKRSYDESINHQTVETLDLATYAKNIGLKPIEIPAHPENNATEGNERLKNSPSASPMSTSSSSTTSSTNSSNFPLLHSAGDITGSTSSSHKKRKKKHSKDPNGKRRKLHAEISSQLQEESLKMKVKITAHKSHKSESRRSAHNSESGSKSPSIERECEVLNKIKLSETSNGNTGEVAPKRKTPSPAKEPFKALNRALSEEIKSINRLIDNKQQTKHSEELSQHSPLNDVAKVSEETPQPQEKATKTDKAAKHTKADKPLKPEKASKAESKPKADKTAKPDKAIKVDKLEKSDKDKAPEKVVKNTNYAVPVPRKTLPHLLPKPSPPLPPSLFKSLAFATLTNNTFPALATMPTLQPISMSNEKLLTQHYQPTQQLQFTSTPALTPTSLAQKTPQTQQFAVPNPPRQKYLGHPSSIASAHNKQLQSLQLKRSASLDDGYASSSMTKQQKLAQDMLQRKSAYGPLLHSLASSYQQQQQQQNATFSQQEEKSTNVKPLEAGFYSPVQPTATSSTAANDAHNRNSKNFLSFAATLANPSAVTITQRPKSGAQSLLSMRLTEPTPNPLNKPAVELLKLNAQSTGATEMPPLHPPLSPPAGTHRLMGPPLSLLKNHKKPATHAATSLLLPAATGVKSPPLPLLKAAAAANRYQQFQTQSQHQQQQQHMHANHAAYRSSPPALINLRNTVPLSFPTKPTIDNKKNASNNNNNVGNSNSNNNNSTNGSSNGGNCHTNLATKTTATTTAASTSTTTATATTTSSTVATKTTLTESNISQKSTEAGKLNGCAGGAGVSVAGDKPKTSLRDFRPIHKDGISVSTNNNNNNNIDILDLSSTNRNQHDANAAKEPSIATPIGSSLEAALNKIKQNMSTACTHTPTTDNNNKSKLSASTTAADDLQNLHLLSESATAREKIAITAPLFQKPKPQATNIVRQQNASVRSIPNPSALAFRNQPMLTATTTASTTTATTGTTSSTTTASVTNSDATTVTTATTTSVTSPPTLSLPPLTKSLQLLSSTLPSPKSEEKMQLLPLSLPTTPKTPNTTAASTTVMTTTTTSPPRPMKKLTSIDQVAANLNIRAAAAEASASAAKAMQQDEQQRQSVNTTVTPSVSTTTTNAADTATSVTDIAKPTTTTSTTTTPAPVAVKETTEQKATIASATPDVADAKEPCENGGQIKDAAAPKGTSEDDATVKENTSQHQQQENDGKPKMDTADSKTERAATPKSPFNCTTKAIGGDATVPAPSITNSA